MRFRSILLLSVSLALVACGVDITGLSAESSRTAKGNTGSAVIVAEFGDLQCPACKAAHEQLNKWLMEAYGSKVQFVFKHFPLRQVHPFAFEAAQASECAADQGKFWEYIDLVYENQSSLSSSNLRAWAAQLNLDGDLFDRCLRSGIKKDTILADYAEGEKLGVSGTPTYFVNGQRVESTAEAIGAAIEKALVDAKTQQQMPL